MAPSWGLPTSTTTRHDPHGLCGLAKNEADLGELNAFLAVAQTPGFREAPAPAEPARRH